MPTITTVRSGDAELYVEQHGSGPDVLLLAGLGDTVEVWSHQVAGLADRYRITTFDNRGVGRSPLPPSGVTVPALADDAAAVIRALDLEPVHAVGFSGGGVAAQELALRHPDVVRSLVLNGTFARFDVRLSRILDGWLTLAKDAESPRAFLEQFLVSIYTREAHEDGRVEAWIDEFLEFEHPTSDEAFVAYVEAYRAHDALDRLPAVRVPALVIAGEQDPQCTPSTARELARAIPGAELVLMPGQSHQPFQEVPDEWNALVDEFLARVGG